MTAEAEELITLDEVASAGRTALYRLYNVADEVIYIGISDDPVGRMQQHADDKPWWPEVARKTAVWYPYREQADRAETIAIGLEQPKYNIAKRYVRLAEQPLEASPRRRQRRAHRPPVQMPSAPSAPPVPDPRAPTESDRAPSSGTWLSPNPYLPHFSERTHAGLPSEWPADLWCVDLYYADEGGDRDQQLGYEDWMRVRHGGCWDTSNPASRIPGSLDYLRTRAADRKQGADGPLGMSPGATHEELYVQPGRNGTWIARTDSPYLGDDAPDDRDTSEQQRRFLFALKRAGRCASFQLGSRAWADGIEHAEEARVVAAVLVLGSIRSAYMARATGCLEARYREPTLRRNGWRWPCDLHDIRRPRRNGTLFPAPGQRCYCWSDCREHPECLEEGSRP